MKDFRLGDLDMCKLAGGGKMCLMLFYVGT